MAIALQEILGVAPDARPHDLAQHLEKTEDALYDRARQGDPGARNALVRLRLAYLQWAYGKDGKSVQRRESAEAIALPCPGE
jgi:hypothetical protein